jgi:hypothetical protein
MHPQRGRVAPLFADTARDMQHMRVTCRVLPDSVDLLREASALRAGGGIGSEVQLWAVGNPVTEEDAHRLEVKVTTGATAVLTQPPLAWDAFQWWMEDARRRQLDADCKLIIGVPLLTSAAHVQFWIQLCGAPLKGTCALRIQQSQDIAHHARKHSCVLASLVIAPGPCCTVSDRALHAGELADLVQTWRRAETKLSTEDFNKFRLEWNQTFVQKVRNHARVLNACPCLSCAAYNALANQPQVRAAT